MTNPNYHAGGILARVRGWFAGLDFHAAREAERQAKAEREATARANAAFDRHGPSARDLLPGGRYQRQSGRRKPPGRWLR